MRRAHDLEIGEDLSPLTLAVTVRIKRMLREVSSLQKRSQAEIAREALETYLGRAGGASD